MGNPGTTVRLDLGVLDVAAGEVRPTTGPPVRLSPTETRLVAYLARYPNEPLDKDTLLVEVWGYAPGSASRTLITTVERLRRKIEQDPGAPRHVVTIGTSGYMFRPLAPEADRGAGAALPPDRARELDWLVDALRRSPERVSALVGPPGAGIEPLAAAVADRLRGELPGGAWVCRLDQATTAEAVVAAMADAVGLAPEPDAERHRVRLERALRALGPSLLVLLVGDAAASVRGPLSALLARWPAPRPALLVVGRRALDLPGEQVLALAPPETTPTTTSPAGTPFVGREEDLAALRVAGHRVVTLTGPPGVGKTRLARELAATWTGEHRFVSMRDRRTRHEVVTAFASALDLGAPQAEGVDWLVHVVAHRPGVLWVVDDAEGCIDALDVVLPALHDALGGGSRLVVTSRVAPAFGAEHPVAPLAARDAVALFVAEARRADPTVALDGDLLRLVQALDGLPLAIELAAARSSVLTPAQLEERLARRFAVLKSVEGRGGRHRSLQAAIEVSYELLGPEQRDAFAQCHVFRGGFGLDAAEAVLDAGDASALDVLHALRRAALIEVQRPEIPGAERRFDLLASLAAFAGEKLDDAARAVAEVRHGQYYATRSDTGPIHDLDGHHGTNVQRAALRDRDNLLVACRRALVRGDAEVAARTAIAASVALKWTGPLSALSELTPDVLRMVDRLPADLAIRLRLVVAQTGLLSGDDPDRVASLYREALEALGASGSRQREAAVTGELAAVVARQGRMDEAMALFDHAVALARAVGDQGIEALTLHNAGTALLAGRPDDAAEASEEALALYRALGRETHTAGVLTNLGLARQAQGRLAEAEALQCTALDVVVLLGDRRTEGSVRSNLANLQRLRGDPDAVDGFEAAIRIGREVGDRAEELAASLGLAVLHLDAGRVEAAAELISEILALARRLRSRLPFGHALGCRGRVLQARGDLTGARDAYAESVAALADASAPGSEGQFLGFLGAVHAALGEPDAAERCFASAEDLLRRADRVELVRLACHRARAALAAGQREAARAAVTDAEAQLDALQLGPEAPLRAEARAVRRDMEG